MRRLALALVACTLLFAFYAGAAAAASFLVNTTSDTTDSSIGNGICEDGGGRCSLRAAVQEANAWPGWDDVEVPGGVYELTLVGPGEDLGATGDLDVRSELSIIGDGPAQTWIDGVGADRVFDLLGAHAFVTGVTVRNGFEREGAGMRLRRSSLHMPWAAFWVNNATYAGGAIWTMSGNVILTGVSFVANKAGQFGGALYLGGPTWTYATLENVTVDRNSVRTYGGGIYSAQPLRLYNVTVSSNRAGYGGGIYYTGSIPESSNTIVAYNTQNDCSGWLTSIANNLDTDKTCGFFNPGDLPGVDPFLDPLTFGGTAISNWIRALPKWSPALDAGDNLTCLLEDEIATPRPSPAGGRCDIGAYEAP